MDLVKLVDSSQTVGNFSLTPNTYCKWSREFTLDFRSHAISMSFDQSDGVSSSVSIEDTNQVLVWRQLASLESSNWDRSQNNTSLKSMKCPSTNFYERGSRQIQIPIPCGGSKVAKQNMIGIHWKCLQFSSSMVEGVVRLCWFLLVPVLLELKWFSMLRTSSWIFFNSARPKISISSQACQSKTYVAFIVAHAKHVEHVA